MNVPARRCLAAAGVVGPVVFVTDWAALGAVAARYDPIRDTISRLAETGVATQPAMSVGFGIYGVALPLFACSRDTRLPSASRALVAVTGLSTLVVAAFPVSACTGTVHATAAGVGYAALALAPLLHARSLARSGHRGASVASAAVGLGCALLLAASTVAPATGLLQRAGLTVGDAWIVTHAIASSRRVCPLSR